MVTCRFKGHAAILHVDADAFFASVEEVLHPELRGKPVIVGGRSGRGVVSSANYAARKYGVKSAMSMGEALRRCPQAHVVCSGMGNYREFSHKMFEVFRSFTPLVEPTSVDEGYLDLSGTQEMHGMSARETARRLLAEVKRVVGISVSGGLGTTKTIAKIASGLNKPRALTTVPPGNEAAFLAPLELRKMPGIGPKTCTWLTTMGFSTLGELARLSFEEVYAQLGASGISLWQRAQGLDPRKVSTEREPAKSISREITFSKDQSRKDLLLKELRALCSDVLYRLRDKKKKAHVIHLKLRYADFRTFTYQRILPGPYDLDTEIFPLAKELFLRKLSSLQDVRLLGFGVSDLREMYNLTLFDNEKAEAEQITRCRDRLRQKYGKGVVEFGG